MNKIKNIGWVGLGKFGLPIALNLIEKGIQLTAFELFGKSKQGVLEAVKQGAKRSTTPECKDLDALILCLPRSEDVIKVLNHFGDSLPALVIDLTTGDPNITSSLHESLKHQNTLFIDCPVSGSKENARQGELTIFVGFEKDNNEILDHLLKCIGTNIYYFTKVGGGNKAKLINQYIHLSNMAIIKEGLMMASAIELDQALLIDALMHSSSNSVMMQRFGHKIVQQNYSTEFSLALAYKDLNLVRNMISEFGLNLDHESITLNTYKETYHKGFGEENFTVICK